MADPLGRPGFFVSFLDDLRDDVRLYGPKKLIPTLGITCALIGVLAAIAAPEDRFWSKAEIAVAFFAAQVTINGLLLGLSWGSFAKIYEIASRPDMAAFLRKHNLLNTYIFHVDFIHFAQVVALCLSGLALFVSVLDRLPPVLSNYVGLLTVQKLVMALSIAASLYALRYALGAVRIMQDLVWHSARLATGGSQQDLVVRDGGKQDQIRPDVR